MCCWIVNQWGVDYACVWGVKHECGHGPRVRGRGRGRKGVRGDDEQAAGRRPATAGPAAGLRAHHHGPPGSPGKHPLPPIFFLSLSCSMLPVHNDIIHEAN